MSDATDLFVERLGLQHVGVRRVAAAAVAAEAEVVCAELGVRRLGVPPGLPSGWRPAGATWSRTTTSRRLSSMPWTQRSQAAR